MPQNIARGSVSLVHYMKQRKEEDTVNLMEQMTTDLPPPKQNEDPNVDSYFPHWKNTIDINLVCDFMKYSLKGGIPSEIAANLRVDWDIYAYDPIVYMSDFWMLKKNMIALNESIEGKTLNLTLNFQNFGSYWYQFQTNFAKQYKQQEEWGLQQFDFDEMKRMYAETDKILLSVTVIVSLLHTVFEMLAFKNDIAFWNNKESMEGISVKSLYFHLI